MMILLTLLYRLAIKPLMLWVGDDGCGLTITWESSFFSGVIKSASWGGISRKAIDKSSTESPNSWMEFFPGCLKDPGELTVDIIFDPDDEPPISEDAETVTVNWPIPAGMTTGAAWSCSGFMTNYEATGPHDDMLTAKVTIKFTGTPTFGNAS